MTDNTCVTFAVILHDHFCMKTKTDTGNLSRDEKWHVEIRSYKFKTKKIHTYDKKTEIEDSRFLFHFFKLPILLREQLLSCQYPKIQQPLPRK